jgi:hypothetical protein
MNHVNDTLQMLSLVLSQFLTVPFIIVHHHSIHAAVRRCKDGQLPYPHDIVNALKDPECNGDEQ